MRTTLLLAATGALFACSARAALIQDESHRLDEDLRGRALSDEAAAGVALGAAPPLAKGSRGESYALKAGRKLKLARPARLTRKSLADGR